MASINGTFVAGPAYIQTLHNFSHEPVMPGCLREAHYEKERVCDPTNYGMPEVLRPQEYRVILSGGRAVYGSHFTCTFAQGWKSNLDTVGVEQLMVWHECFSSLPRWTLVPDQAHTVLTARLGAYGNVQTRVTQGNFCTVARPSDGSLVAAYIPTARQITANMASLKGPVYGKWFDPTNGAHRTISGGPFAVRGK